MASPSKQPDRTLAELLFDEPWRFDFFQAVRVLERLALDRPPDRSPTAAASPAGIGHDGPLTREIVRFHAHPSLTFPPSSVTAMRAGNRSTARDDRDSTAPPHMTISFLGLFGPSGVLPRHYTHLILERIRQRDHTLQAFLDLFNHRLTSLFYRAWEKYRFPIGYERAVSATPPRLDLFTWCLDCLVGQGTHGLRSRLEIEDATFVYFANYFSNRRSTATGLEDITTGCFGVAATVHQFEGQWLYLSEEDQSRPASALTGNWNHCLGTNVIVGERVWSVENKFRLRLGPLNYSQFRRFTPFGDQLIALAQLIRHYVGTEFDFDIQPVLRAEEVPPCRLGGDSGDPSYLGWNTWLISEPLVHDAEDALFVSEGLPTRAGPGPLPPDLSEF